MASRDKADVDAFHKCIQYALEKLGKSKSGFEGTVVSKFKSNRRVGSGNEVVDYSRAPCLGANQKTRGLWGRDWHLASMLCWYRSDARQDDSDHLKLFYCKFQKCEVMTMSVVGDQPKKYINTSYKATKHVEHAVLISHYF